MICGTHNRSGGHYEPAGCGGDHYQRGRHVQQTPPTPPSESHHRHVRLRHRNAWWRRRGSTVDADLLNMVIVASPAHDRSSSIQDLSDPLFSLCYSASMRVRRSAVLRTMKPLRVRPSLFAARSMRASMATGILTGTSFRLVSPSPGEGSPAPAMNAGRVEQLPSQARHEDFHGAIR